MKTKKHILSSLCFFLLIAVPLLFFVTNLNAAGGPPAGYYSSIEGLQGESLKTTLGTLTRHRLTTLYGYGSKKENYTWDAFWTTDRNPSDNSVIDMYSTVKRYFNPSDTTASVVNCDIEHMFPNSWFGKKAGCKEAYCDLHHLVPADKPANISKSNNGPGVPTDTIFDNGVWVNGKDAARDNITVFCPPDEYKGDFARALMYIALTYGDTVTWTTDDATPHMDNSSWQEFTTTTRDLLLGWHRADPVSDKERVRMEAVYRMQGNRNPFIDYPCLVEYIWGDKTGTAVSLASITSAYDKRFVDEGCTVITEPFITAPYGKPVQVGSTQASVAINHTITIKGVNLTSGDLNLSLSGANADLFSLSTYKISNSSEDLNYDVTVTYTPTAIGEHTATLTFSGCGVTSQTVTLSGKCPVYYTATWKTGGTTHATTYAPTGSRPSLPAKPDDCIAPRVFVGWTAQESVNNKPADLFTEQAPALTSNKTFYAVYADATPGSVGAGSEVYIFTSKIWEADEGDWDRGNIDGSGFAEGQGVRVSTSVTGANATCPDSYNDIRSVVVNYCTNSNAGAGDISITVGGTTKTNSVTKTGGTTLRDSEFDFSAAPQNGAVQLTVTCTTNSIYINSVTINHGTPTTYSDYSLLCGGEAVEVTATFKNGTATHATETGLSGTTIDTPADPTPCGDYTFYCWSTQEYETLNAAAPEEDYTGYFVLTDKTYHAVYKRTEGSGGGGAAAGTTLWEESFEGFSKDDVPESSNASTTVYGSGSVTYSCDNGENTSYTTKIYTGSMSAGGSSPELMVPSKKASFTISGIPTGNAKVMTLTFKSNKGTDILSLSSGTSGITIGTPTYDSDTKTWTCDISNTTNETFDLTITNVNKSSTNARVDNLEVSVKTAASGSGSTYYTTSPDCGECTYLLTVQSEDDTKGTAAIE